MADSGLGTMLRFLRERTRLKLREVSQLSEVDHAYIYRLETGEKDSPSEEILNKILKVLKPTDRERQMTELLVRRPNTDPELVTYVLADESIGFDVFEGAAVMAFRGAARPDMAKLISRVKRILEEDEDG